MTKSFTFRPESLLIDTQTIISVNRAIVFVNRAIFSMDFKSSSFSFFLDQWILPEFLRVRSFSMTFVSGILSQWDASTLTESVGTSNLLSTSDQGTRYQGTILKGKAKDINIRSSSKVFQNHAIMITISHIIHCNRILYLLIHSNCITHTVYCLRTDAVLYKLYFNISIVSISYCMAV